MCRIVLPGGRDPQQPCGLCAGAEIALDGGAHNPFSYLPVATCASRQTSPRKISIRFWLTGWRLKNKKICATPPYQVQPTRGPAHPLVASDSRSHSAQARRAARRGGWRGQPAIAHTGARAASTVRLADRVRTHRLGGIVGNLFAVAQFAHKSEGVGDLWVMWVKWSRKKNRSGSNGMHATRSRLYVYTVVFLF
jgi:hypothetical protein